MGSDIKSARILLSGAMRKRNVAYDLMDEADQMVEDALGMMTREYTKRRAPAKNKMTKAKDALIRKLAALHPDWTQHQLAEAAGAGNAGRVSESLRRQ